MSPKSDPQIGRVLGSQYRIEALLGQGGMGAVYRGVQLSVQRPVAIKLINASAANQAEILTRFRREAEATARLSHPNTVRLFDFGVTESHEMFMVMELLEGCDLAARLAQGPLPLSEALFIVREVLQALSEAHALGIVHRDLKPGNVFLARVHGGESVVKVMDFGIAGIEQARDGQKLTMTGAVMGTPAYMSPEQAQGKPVDARCDLYSIGVMLFEMLTGRPPFDANTLVSLLLAHVTQPPKRLEEAGVQLPNQAALQALLDRLLAKNPIDRPPSAAHASTVIDALLAQSSSEAAAHGRSLPAPQTARFSAPTNVTAQLPAPAIAHTTPQETPVGWDMTAEPPATAQPSAAKPASRGWLVGSLGVCALLALVTFMAMRPAGSSTDVVKVKQDPQPSAAGSSGALEVQHVQHVQPPKDSPAKVTVALPRPEEEDDAKRPAGHHPGHTGKLPGAHGKAPVGEETPAEEPASVEVAQTSAPPQRGDQERVRREALLRRAPPYASLAAAQRAYGSGKIDANALQDAVWVLKTRRNERIEIEKENLKRGTISAQEYEWRLGRIDAELRGE